MLIHYKGDNDIEFVTEFPCFIGSLVYLELRFAAKRKNRFSKIYSKVSLRFRLISFNHFANFREKIS